MEEVLARQSSLAGRAGRLAFCPENVLKAHHVFHMYLWNAGIRYYSFTCFIRLQYAGNFRRDYLQGICAPKEYRRRSLPLLADTEFREDEMQYIVGRRRTSKRIQRTQRGVQVKQHHLLR